MAASDRVGSAKRDRSGAPGRRSSPSGRGAGSPAEVAVLLTGVGKRYDIVSAFAQHATVIAADPNPLAPAQYAKVV